MSRGEARAAAVSATSPQIIDSDLDLARNGAPAPATASPPVESEPLEGRGLIFFVCAIALFMASCDSTIVATSLNSIGEAFGARVNWLAWTITIYSLGQIIMLPLAGKISDQFGRKNLFLASAIVFTASSVACGLSTSLWMLLPLRFIQSLGGGGFLPSASGIVADHFGSEHDRALGLFSSIFPIGSVCGPIFGGLITEYWQWRGIFFVNLPIGLLLIVLIIRVIPQSAQRSNERLDIPGVLLLATTLVSGMVAITLLGESDVSPISAPFLAPLGASVVLGALFMRHTGHAESPIIPRNLIVGKGFGAMNLINVLFGGAGFGFGVLMPLYARNRYGIPLLRAGSILAAQALGMTIVAACATYLLRRTGYRRPMAIGFLIVAASLIALSIAPRHVSPYVWLAFFSMISGIGLGTVAPTANNATLSLAPTQVAAISGLRATFRQSGMIMSVSAVTAIVARSDNPGLAQARMFWVLALILVAIVPMTLRVPDRKGAW